jgi:hypothetical protein
MKQFSSKQLFPLVKKTARESSTPVVNKRQVYWGAHQCQASRSSGQPCPNQAYYAQHGRYCCGVHSRKGARTELPKDPGQRQRNLQALGTHKRDVLRVSKLNGERGQRGQVQCQAMQMMKPVPLTEGFMNVFPNNRHQARVDGYGCCALSPMRLGPVAHRQPGLPPALNVENYHQFNKVWPTEVDADKNPKPEFFALQRAAYDDAEPHRHKYDDKEMTRQRKAVPAQANRNAPLYSLHLNLDGVPQRFSYVQSRYFYCCAYEALAREQTEFRVLRKLLGEGVNLMICGYDARPVDEGGLDAMYADASKPFGHELVLYAMLTVEEPLNYPWHRYRRANALVYENVAHVVTV